jgi:hypothetical protein
MANDPRFEVYPQVVEMHDADCPATNDPPDPCICRGPFSEPGGHAPVLDTPKGGGPEFGWRFRAGNGQISAVGGEGFTRREDARRAVIDFCRALGLAFDGPGRPAECHNVIPPVIDVDE